MEQTYAGIAKDKYALLSELGSKFNLSFSSHLELGNTLIALDGLNKTLLVYEVNNELSQPYIIRLVEVMAVSINKTYGNIGPGELKARNFEEFLNRVEIHFKIRDKVDPLVLTFYESAKDELLNLPRLERIAKSWQMILSKLAVSPVRNINRRNRSLAFL